MISTTWWPRSWNSRSLRRTTVWPRWMSGVVGSTPSLTRSAGPVESCRSSSPAGSASPALRVRNRAASPAESVMGPMLDSRARLAPVTLPCGRAPVTKPPRFRTDAGDPPTGPLSHAGAADAYHKPSLHAQAPLPARQWRWHRGGPAHRGLAGRARRRAAPSAAPQAEAEEAAARLHPARDLAARAGLDRVRDADG